MATLERIRSKGVLLIVIIGLALLAFIVGDFLNHGSSFFNGSKDLVAKINGQKIKITEFQDAIEQLSSVYKIEYGISNIDENTTLQIRQSVWDSYVKENLIASEAEKIGIAVGSNELKDMTTGNNPSPLITGRRIFANPQTGQFDKTRLVGFLSQLENKPSDPAQQEEYNTAKNYWMYFEKLLKTSKLEEKYNTLLSRAINANSIEAKLAFEAKKSVVDVVYISSPYSAIPDNKVTVSDAEISAKYDQIKERYKQKTETRDVKVVSFNLAPSQKDYAKAQEWINKLKPEFATTNEIKAVVNANSKVPYNDIATSVNSIDPDLKAFAMSGTKGQVFGPVLFGTTYKMARIVESGIVAPDSIKLKHIVVATQDSAKTKVLADSIFNALNGGADFAALAAKYSQMQQTAMKGGEIGWVPVSTIEPKMADVCVAQPINKYFTYKDGKAIQILQLEEKSANRSKVKLAVIASDVTPSQETYAQVYNEAKQFAATATTPEAFEKTAKQKGYIVQPVTGIDANTPMLAGIQNSRQVVRWAFNKEVEKGTVSDVYDCTNQFVVAAVTDITKPGYRSLESTKEEIKQMLLVDKKADVIMSELKTKNTANFEALAAQLAAKIDTAKQVNFEARTFGNAGFEPEVIANVSLAKLNQVSAPIKGKSGVFIYKATNIIPQFAPFDAKTEKANLSTKYMYSVYTAVEALKDKAEIEDNRAIFY